MLKTREEVLEEYLNKDLYLYNWHDDAVFHRTNKDVWFVKHEGTPERMTYLDKNKELQLAYNFPIVIKKEEYETLMLALSSTE